MYSKQICECGKKLMAHQSIGYEEYYYISVEGKLSKRKIKGTEIVESTNLACSDITCGKLYHIRYDNEGRIFKGEEIN